MRHPRRFARTAAVLVVLLSALPLAHADQCQSVDADVASRAAAAIGLTNARVLQHCAPCGDAPPVVTTAFVPGSVRSTGSSVLIDGQEVDLAYTYLEVAPGVFENVALRTGCPATGVPEVWRFENGAARAMPFGAIPARLRRVGWGQPLQRAPLPLPG